MVDWIALLIVIVALASAVAALVVPNMVGAVAAASVTSLGVSVSFVLLRAPDVAMTEAAIGSGLTTFLFFFVLDRVRGGEHD